MEDLRAQIRERRAVVVAGPRVSLAASGDDERASWRGLLLAALEWCEGSVPALSSSWRLQVRNMVTDDDVSLRLAAADLITDKLGGPTNGEYARMLRETVGSLRLVDSTVPAALCELRVPLATTNYDDLIEQATGWPGLTWLDSSEVQRVLKVEEGAVIHLHGLWRKATSVALGIRSYEKLLANERAQALLRAMATMGSLVFVGMENGPRDPNLRALIDWLAGTFPESESRHFWLCLDHEVEAVAREHPAPEQIKAVSYGRSTADLARFLRSLAPDATSPVGRTVPSRFLALPARRPTFGRDAEVAGIIANLLRDQPSRTLILGAPGIGKTNLTLAALHSASVAERYGARRVFVRCEAAGSASATLTQLASALGVALTDASLLDACLDRLAAAPTVVALDNAETPWEADVLATEELFAAIAGVDGVALVVSMRGVERPGGLVWTPVRLGPLGLAEARTLFLSISPDAYDDAGLDDLLKEMGGFPLAVELLAHAAEGEAGLEALAERWRAERVRLLEKGRADHPLLSVRVSIEASWNGKLMTELGRRLLSLLGRLPDGVAVTDIDALLPDGGRAAANLLRRRGLVFDERQRLRTYPPIRYHVAADHPSDAEDWRRAINHYRSLVEQQGARVGNAEGAAAARRLTAESSNLTVTFLEGLGGPEPGATIEAIDVLAKCARFTGIDLSPLLSAAIETTRAMNNLPRLAVTIEDSARIARVRSDHEAARKGFEEALAIHRRTGSLQGEANCLLSLGAIDLLQVNYALARRRLKKALALYQQTGDVNGQAQCMADLARIALMRYDYTAARTGYEAALHLHRQIGSLLGQANCAVGLGDADLEEADHSSAASHYRRARTIFRDIGDVLGEANSTIRLGQVALTRGELDDAEAEFRDSLRASHEVGHLLGVANSTLGLGDVALARSVRDRASVLYNEALPLHRRAGNVLGEALCNQKLGDIAVAARDDGQARRRYETALLLFRQAGNVLGQAECNRSLADIDSALSDTGRAATRYRKALTLFRQCNDAAGQAECSRALGNIALARSDLDETRRQYEEARGLFERAGDLLETVLCALRLGEIALRQSDSEKAWKHFEETLRLSHTLGFDRGEAESRLMLGQLAMMRSDHDVARTHYEAALPLLARLEMVGDAGRSNLHLGHVARELGDADMARDRYKQAAALFAQAGDARGESICRHVLGDIALEHSDYDVAREWYETAALLHERGGDLLGKASCLERLGVVAIQQADLGRSSAHFEQALALCRDLGAELGEANCLAGLGAVAQQGEDYETARERCEEALVLYRKLDSVLGQANCYYAFGEIAEACNDRKTATTSYGRALALYERLNNQHLIDVTRLRLAAIATLRSP